MKISALNKDLITAVYEHEGDNLTIKVDRNIITPSFLRHIAELRGETNGNGHHEEPKEMTWADSADSLEKNVKIGSSVLATDLLREWDLTEDDGVTPVPITEESFSRLPPVLVVRLFAFAMEQAQTVKKTITETTPATSPEKAADALTM